jgi:hypothetical protein
LGLLKTTGGIGNAAVAGYRFIAKPAMAGRRHRHSKS